MPESTRLQAASEGLAAVGPRAAPMSGCGASAGCSYRGYGQSQGVPGEAGIKQDAQAGLDHLLSRSDIKKDRVRAPQGPDRRACMFA